MSGYVNLRGRLGKDPVSRSTASGKNMVTASLAVSLQAKQSNVVQWFDLVAFGRCADALSQHGKGDAVAVFGTLQLNVWEKDGTERKDLSVVLDAVLSARRASAALNAPRAKASQTTPAPSGSPPPHDDPFDDDIPF